MFSGSKELTCITSITPMKMNEKWLRWISRNILCVAKVPPGGESRYYSEFTAVVLQTRRRAEKQNSSYLQTIPGVVFMKLLYLFQSPVCRAALKKICL